MECGIYGVWDRRDIGNVGYNKRCGIYGMWIREMLGCDIDGIWDVPYL